MKTVDVDGAVKAFYDEIKKAIKKDGVAVVSLCGGTSVQEFYKKIPKHAKELSKEEWEKVHFFLTDERRVPLTSKESNYRLCDKLFLKELGKKKLLLGSNVHTYIGDAENIENETGRYTEKLNQISDGKIHIPVLGTGPDGHVAALYPGHKLLKEKQRKYLLLDDSPKPPAKRMTCSPKHITTSDAAFVFFISERKRKSYDNFKDKDVDVKECPAKLAKQSENCYVVTDLA